MISSLLWGTLSNACRNEGWQCRFVKLPVHPIRRRGIGVQGWAGYFLAQTMLLVRRYLVRVSVGHYFDVYYVFQHHTAHRDQWGGPVVSRSTSVIFLEDWCNFSLQSPGTWPCWSVDYITSSITGVISLATSFRKRVGGASGPVTLWESRAWRCIRTPSSLMLKLRMFG